MASRAHRTALRHGISSWSPPGAPVVILWWGYFFFHAMLGHDVRTYIHTYIHAHVSQSWFGNIYWQGERKAAFNLFFA